MPPKKKSKEEIAVDNAKALDLMEHSVIDNVRVYNGVRADERASLESYIDERDVGCRLTELTSNATITGHGDIYGAEFEISEFISRISGLPPTQTDIIRVGSNFEEIYVYPNPHSMFRVSLMARSIGALPADKIRIGCHCQPLFDTAAVRDTVLYLCEHEDAFKQEYDAYAKQLPYTVRRQLKQLREFKSGNLSDIAGAADAPVRQYIDRICMVVAAFDQYVAQCRCEKGEPSADEFKPLSIKKTSRHVHGAGTHFNNQVSFEVYSRACSRTMKIKLFHGCTFNAPGINGVDMLGAVGPINALASYVRGVLGCESSEMPYIISSVRTHHCALADDKVSIMCDVLDARLKEATKLTPPFTIGGITLDKDGIPALVIQFSRPTAWADSSKTTAKISTAGKVQIVGNSVLDARAIYCWLAEIIELYWDDIVYDPEELVCSDDSAEYESLYDDDSDLDAHILQYVPGDEEIKNDVGEDQEQQLKHGALSSGVGAVYSAAKMGQDKLYKYIAEDEDTGDIQE